MQPNELHTYLALMGNQRLRHLEEEIFADNTAITIYLHNLCREEAWYEDYLDSADLAAYYARFVIRGHWVAAAPMILADQYWQHNYLKLIDRATQ